MPEPTDEFEKTLVIFGGAVKALGEGRVGGYLVQFGSPEQPDLEGDFFTAETDLGEASTSPVYYQHGQDKRLGRRKLGRAELRKDEFGVWAETQLSMRDEYEQFIYGMAEKGKMGWSSGTAGHLVEREPEGRAQRIKSWPLGLDASLTPTPAEPRNTVVPLKSWQPPDLPDAQADAGQPAPGAAEAEAAFTDPVIEIVGERRMSEQPIQENAELKALEGRIDEMGQNINRLMKLMEDAPSLKNAGYFSVDGGKADPQVKSFGDFLQAIYRRDDTRLQAVYGSTKDLNTDAGGAGGYLVPTDYNTDLLRIAKEASPILSRIQRIPVGPPAGEWPALDQFAAPTAGVGDTALAAGLTAAITAEGGALTEDEPTFEMIKWRLHKIGGYTQVTNELMSDSPLAIESLLRELFGIAVSAKEEYYVLRGNGAGQPLGVFNAPATVGVTTAADNTFSMTDAVAMLARFKVFNRANVLWTCHNSLIPDLGAVVVASGNPNTWLQSPRNGLPSTILDFPWATSEHMAQANGDDMLLADWTAYKFFVKGGLSIAFSEHYGFINELGTWRFSERLDGQPWMKAAITLADPTGSYTVSPFVYHDD